MRDSKIACGLSVLAIAVSSIAIYASVHGFTRPPFDPAPHEAAGWVLGQKALSLLEPGGKVLVFARDTSTFKNPASDAMLAGLGKALRNKRPGIDSLRLIQSDPLRPVEVPPGDFFELMRTTPRGSVIVSLLGPPLLSEPQRARLANAAPAVVAFCSGSIPETYDLRVLFEQKLLRVAVINKKQAHDTSHPSDLQGCFDRFFVCVTAANLNALPPSGASLQ